VSTAPLVVSISVIARSNPEFQTSLSFSSP
jgi:hypothetical protein